MTSENERTADVARLVALDAHAIALKALREARIAQAAAGISLAMLIGTIVALIWF